MWIVFVLTISHWCLFLTIQFCNFMQIGERVVSFLQAKILRIDYSRVLLIIF